MAKSKGKGPSNAGQATKVYNHTRSARGGKCVPVKGSKKGGK
jgi:hypothetical protein